MTEGKEPLFVQATLDFPFEQGTGALSLTAFLIGASAPVPIPAGLHLPVLSISLLARCAMCHKEERILGREHTHGLETFTHCSGSVCLAWALAWGYQLHSPSTVEFPNGKDPEGGCH